jgi:hypothetical protein
MWFGIAAAIDNTIAAGIVRTPSHIARLCEMAKQSAVNKGLRS